MFDSFSQPVTNSIPMIALVIAMALSMLLIPFVWRFASRLGLIDKPNARKVHTKAVPRVGGWGIVIGSLIPIITLLEITPFITSYVFGAVILFCFGAFDDAHEVGHYTKFVGQFLAAGIVVYYGDLWIQFPPFSGLDGWSESIGKPLTFVAIVGMINASNHADGLDGLAGGESLLSFIIIAYLAYVADGMETVVIAAAVIGGILGFLRFNTHPAEIFMGDTGSTFLGFTLAVLVIHLTQTEHTALAPALMLLILGLPTIDILAVLFLRIRGGMSWFKATRNHIHHRLLDLGFDHYETVIINYSVQALMVISAIFLRYQSDFLVTIIYILFALIFLGLLTRAERTGWRSGQRSRSLKRTVVYFRNHQLDIANVAFNLIKIIIPVYLISAMLFIEAVPRDFGMIAAAFFVVRLLDMLYHREPNGFSLRGSLYIMAIFSVYLVSQSERISDLAYLNSFPFVLLAIAIAFLLRYANDNKFQTSPMDYLIVFGVLAVALFGGQYLQVKDVGVLVVKCMLMIYGCEFILTHMKRLKLLNLSVFLTMAIMAYRGVIA